MNIDPKYRTWLYTVATAAIPLLVIAGVVAADHAALWLNLAAAVLGLGAAGTATMYRPTITASERDDYEQLLDSAYAAVALYRAEAPAEQLAAAIDHLGAQVKA